MPHDQADARSRGRFRLSIGGAMAAVFILGCAFATWHAMPSGRYESAAWVQWSAESSHPRMNRAIVIAAAARLGVPPGDVASGLAVGIPVQGTHLLQVRRGTGDPGEDAKVVDAVATELIAAHPPGELKLISRARAGTVGGFGWPLVARGLLSALAGLSAQAFLLLIRWTSRTLTPRRPQFRELTLLVAGTSK